MRSCVCLGSSLEVKSGNAYNLQVNICVNGTVRFFHLAIILGLNFSQFLSLETRPTKDAFKIEKR